MKKETKYNAIEVVISGIKCDACDYKDMSVKFEEYINYLNKPCPECSANLLTEKDYKNTLKMVKVVSFFNKILPKKKVKASDLPTNLTVSAKMNGTGKVQYNAEINEKK